MATTLNGALTPWYPEHMKPVRSGWYECRCCNLGYWWDCYMGKWRNVEAGGYSLKQDLEWRGLANDPMRTTSKGSE